MHLANHYPLWGSMDLGFRLKFEVGYKDQSFGRQGGTAKTIVLTSNREVVEKLNSFSFRDSENKAYNFNDCYRVDVQVKLNKLVNN